MPDINIGKRIKELREMQKLSRDELATKIGISSKYLYEIENGKKNFSSEILCKLAMALSVSCDYIMRGEDNLKREDDIKAIVEKLNTKQIASMRKILKVLYDLCSIWDA